MEKYKVSQELMNDINDWRDRAEGLVVYADLKVGIVLPWSIHDWWMTGDGNVSNNRLIALIQYVNGEDVFEVEKPKKWVVRSKYRTYEQFHFVSLKNSVWSSALKIDDAYVATTTKNIAFAFKFNTKEEAEQFTNPLMEVVEV